MRRTCIWQTCVIILSMTTLGVANNATAELHAVVEESTTLVVLDSDSTEMFRKEIPFAIQISKNALRICETESNPTLVLFSYEVRDTLMINPLPRAYTHHGYKDGELHLWRSHLLLFGDDGEELLSSDIRWRKIYCNNLVFPNEDTLFLFHFDTGELTMVDLTTTRYSTLLLSEWGHMAYPEMEGPIGWVEPFPGNRVVVVRSGYGYDRSEVLLLSEAGEVIWRHEDTGVQRHTLTVDPENRLVITAQIRWQRGGDEVHYSQHCEAISESGEVAWSISLGEVVVKRVRAAAEGILIDVGPRRNTDPGQRDFCRTIKVNPITGVRED